MAAPLAIGAHAWRSCTPANVLCRAVHDSRRARRFPRRDAHFGALALGSQSLPAMAASLHYDDTLIVPKVPIERPRARRVTTQFGPERRAVRWPWAIVAALWIAAVAQPINPVREVRLSAHAQELLRSGH